MKRALYIGKFQPFHIGHLEIVKNMERAPDKVDINPDDYPELSWEWRTFDRISPEDIKRIMALPVFRDEEICDEYLFSKLQRLFGNWAWKNMLQ